LKQFIKKLFFMGKAFLNENRWLETRKPERCPRRHSNSCRATLLRTPRAQSRPMEREGLVKRILQQKLGFIEFVFFIIIISSGTFL
jgi:hypothetical protein